MRWETRPVISLLQFWLYGPYLGARKKDSNAMTWDNLAPLAAC
jgi:hypothetical protein